MRMYNMYKYFPHKGTIEEEAELWEDKDRWRGLVARWPT
jgi:hypothetical protein